MSKQQDRRDEKLKQCLRILERAANAGAQCPTDMQLAELLGYQNNKGPRGLMALLEAAGFIVISKSRTGRVVQIMQTGKQTAGTFLLRTPGGWTEDEDAILMDAVSEGFGFSVAARELRKTKHQCMARFNKIAAQMEAA